MNMNFDICLTCGKESPYTKDTHISERIGYFEGAGQHCFQPNRCDWEQNNRMEELILSLMLLRNNYSNDQEFGEQVRILVDKYRK